MTEEIAKMLTELKDAFHAHCEEEARHTGRIDMLLEQLCKSVDALNQVVSRGSNGKSIAERLTVVEGQIDSVHGQLKRMREKMDSMQVRSIGFWTAWASIACALITAGAAIIVAVVGSG